MVCCYIFNSWSEHIKDFWPDILTSSSGINCGFKIGASIPFLLQLLCNEGFSCRNFQGPHSSNNTGSRPNYCTPLLHILLNGLLSLQESADTTYSTDTVSQWHNYLAWPQKKLLTLTWQLWNPDFTRLAITNNKQRLEIVSSFSNANILNGKQKDSMWPFRG